jgi:hypothetical protein
MLLSDRVVSAKLARNFAGVRGGAVDPWSLSYPSWRPTAHNVAGREAE